MRYRGKMSTIVCHIGNPRSAKPQTLQEYGKLREQIIQRPWKSLEPLEFAHLVTEKGCPFYGALMNGIDLMELQYEKLCWRMQKIAGLDFDKTEIRPNEMVERFENLGLRPWLAYPTFSDRTTGKNIRSYRLLWQVESDLNLSYAQTTIALKKLRELSGNLADKFATNCTRMWQGSTHGFTHYSGNAPLLNLRNLIKC